MTSLQHWTTGISQQTRIMLKVPRGKAPFFRTCISNHRISVRQHAKTTFRPWRRNSSTPLGRAFIRWPYAWLWKPHYLEWDKAANYTTARSHHFSPLRNLKLPTPTVNKNIFRGNISTSAPPVTPGAFPNRGYSSPSPPLPRAHSRDTEGAYRMFLRFCDSPFSPSRGQLDRSTRRKGKGKSVIQPPDLPATARLPLNSTGEKTDTHITRLPRFFLTAESHATSD